MRNVVLPCTIMALLVGLMLLAQSCERSHTVPVDAKLSTEHGRVAEMQYRPAVDMSGNSIDTDLRIGWHNLHEDERYIVVLKCAHGVVFSVNNKSTYARVEVGDSVLIEYYEHRNVDGEITDYDFVDAYPLHPHAVR